MDRNGKSKQSFVNQALFNIFLILAGLESDDEGEDEFFDCRENLDDTSSLAKWSSMELTPMDEEHPGSSNKNQMAPNIVLPQNQSTPGREPQVSFSSNDNSTLTVQ